MVTMNIYWPKGLTNHEKIIEGTRWYFLAELAKVLYNAYTKSERG